MTTDELRESLLAAPKNGYARITAEQRAEMESYCKRYMAFMDAAKTEREATTWAIAEAEKVVAAAKGKADANRILQQSITPELIQLKAVEKWDGKLPLSTSGNTLPFLELK